MSLVQGQTSTGVRRPRVLWVDDDPLILNTAQRLFRNSAFELITEPDAERAMSALESAEIAVIISDYKMPGLSGVDLMERARQISPLTSRILLTGFIEDKLFEEAINRARVFRFATKPWEDQEILNDVQRAVERHEMARAQSELIREVKKQNEELELLTSNLEALVSERTHNLESSKREIEGKIHHLRQLVRFIQDLSRLTSVEEIFSTLKQELRPFHRVRDFFFAIPQFERPARLLYSRGKQVFNHFPTRKWSNVEGLRVNEREDQVYLANEFGRPIGNIIAIPLPLGSKKSLVVAYFEHSMLPDEADSFIKSVSDKLKLVALALDRILVEMEMKDISFHWENTFDGMKDPICILDLDRKVIRANRHFLQQVWGQKCYEQLGGRQSPCENCPLDLVFERQVAEKAQIRLGERQYLVHSYPILWQSDERSTTAINHYVDVTRERELYQKWVQNEKMVAVGHLAGNIAHELNNPLTGIRSLAQILISETQDEVLKGDLTEIEKAALRCQTIIQNLLEFSSEKVAPAQPEDLNDLVRRTIPFLKTALRPYQVHIHYADHDIKVLMQAPLIQQVLFNMIHNACQAMGESGRLLIEIAAQDSVWSTVKIVDSGPGIPPEIINRVFDPFFTTKPEGLGTGLGLSMSRSVIEKMGGRIEVKSRPGDTVFTLFLPISKEEQR